jgi:hypothetical protein
VPFLPEPRVPACGRAWQGHWAHDPNAAYLFTWLRPKLLGDPAGLDSAEALERRVGALEVDVRRRAGQDELRRVLRVSKRVVERNKAAERSSEHDWLLNAERGAEGDDVVGPGVEVPLICTA